MLVVTHREGIYDMADFCGVQTGRVHYCAVAHFKALSPPSWGRAPKQGGGGGSGGGGAGTSRDTGETKDREEAETASAKGGTGAAACTPPAGTISTPDTQPARERVEWTMEGLYQDESNKRLR